MGAASGFVDERQGRGQVTFTLAGLTAGTGLTEEAARAQLRRLRGRVTRVAPRHDFFLILSPEQRPMGAPPASWWLDAYFRWLGQPYYLALLSAAAEYGATRQAIQVVQVMTARAHRELRLGRIRVQFFVKTGIEDTPTRALAGGFAPLQVSTPEATALDLLRYAHRIGGVGRAVETIQQLLPAMRPTKLPGALRAKGELANAQRLGYVLETLGQERLARAVSDFLPRRRTPVDLETRLEKSASRAGLTSERWSVIVNTPVATHA